MDTKGEPISSRTAPTDFGNLRTRPEPRKFAIQVVYKSGDVAYLRHGAKIGYGAVVQFRSKKTAEVNVELISEGLDAGEVASVVRYRKSMEDA